MLKSREEVTKLVDTSRLARWARGQIDAARSARRRWEEVYEAMKR